MNSKYWDHVYESFDDYHHEENIAKYKDKEYLDLIREWFPSIKNKYILKTDCFEESFGFGNLLDTIDTDKIYKIDISKEVIKNAFENSQNSKNKFMVGDIQFLPISNNRFDIIISGSTLDHLNRKNVLRTLKEFERILKPDGDILITLVSKHNPLYFLTCYVANKLNLFPFYQDELYTIREFENLIQYTNLEIAEINSIFHILPPSGKFASLLEKFSNKLSGKISNKIITFTNKIRSDKTKFLTGRLLSFKLKKDD